MFFMRFTAYYTLYKHLIRCLIIKDLVTRVDHVKLFVNAIN